MRREFKDVAIEKCRDHMRNFGQCAQDNGLLIAFKCRHLNHKIYHCPEHIDQNFYFGFNKILGAFNKY